MDAALDIHVFKIWEKGNGEEKIPHIPEMIISQRAQKRERK
jgi:hypothetical protein